MSYRPAAIRSLLSTASNAIEEVTALISEEPTLGDGGVAEALVRAENALTLVGGRFDVLLDREPGLG